MSSLVPEECDLVASCLAAGALDRLGVPLRLGPVLRAQQANGAFGNVEGVGDFEGVGSTHRIVPFPYDRPDFDVLCARASEALDGSV
jgi:hypothetical protein